MMSHISLSLFGIFNVVQVPSGEYRLSALDTTPESASGLIFLPPYIDIIVKSPILNIEFSQVIFSHIQNCYLLFIYWKSICYIG